MNILKPENAESVNSTASTISTDFSEAEKFLQVLASGNAVTFQTFDDDDERKDSTLARILHGTLEEHREGLSRLNEQGAGIFVMVNEGDGRGRRKQNVTAVRAVFVDLDGAPLDPILALPLKPNLIVESSPGRYHAYWLVSDLSLYRFTQVQRALAHRFQGDESVCDLPRVMRLPGFWHRKGEPFLTRIVEFTEAPPYKWQDVAEALDIRPEEMTGVEAHGATNLSSHMDRILEGTRNNTLISFAGTMRRRGMAEEEIGAALLKVNERCDPPLPEDEVAAIARTAGGYEIGLSDKRGPVVSPEKVVALMRRIEDDPKVVLEPESVEIIALLEDREPRRFVEIRERLKGEGVLQPLSAAVKRYRKQHPFNGGFSGVSDFAKAEDMLPGVPFKDLLIPEGYCLDGEGTRMQGETGLRTIAYAPILIAGRLINDEDNVVSLVLAWREKGAWRETLVDRGEALDEGKLVKLASQGFPCASDNRRELVKYLHRLEAINRDRLQEVKSTSHMGWQGREGKAGFVWGKHFIRPDGSEVVTSDPSTKSRDETTDGAIVFKGREQGDEQIVKGFHAHGSVEGWKDAIEGIEKHPKALLALYTSFVPPTLSILKAQSFTLDIAGPTSTGKTTVLRLAASLYGKPDEGASDGIVFTWDATTVFLERVGQVVTDLPLIVDDTKRARYGRTIEETIYRTSSRRGRGRGNKASLAQTYVSRTVVISSGEAPAVSFSGSGGTRARCIQVTGMVFGGQNEETRKFVDALNAKIKDNYGHAGPKFIRWILADPRRRAEMRDYFLKCREKYAHNEAGPTARMADYFAAIETAASYAHLALDLPWDFDESALEEIFVELSKDMRGGTVELSALRDIISWAYSHRKSFICQEGIPSDSEGHTWFGIWAHEKFIAFFPTVLKDGLEELGYSADEIIPAWRLKGFLEAGEKDHHTKQVRYAINGVARARFYVIPMDVVKEYVNDLEEVDD